MNSASVGLTRQRTILFTGGEPVSDITIFLMKGTSMRHVLSRNDYETLFRAQSYPKRTTAAAGELVTRGLKASVVTLDYLVGWFGGRHT